MPLVMGVDSSTQSTKVEIRDADAGELVATGKAAHPPTRPPRSEQDPAAWWSAFEEAMAQAGGPNVAAAAVGGQQHGMVCLDSSGRVIRPAKLWNDTESAPEAAELVARRGAAWWAEACGSVLVASLTITKLAWLAQHEPDALARVAKVLLPHDWLTYRLTGEFTTDRGEASGTGYWSPREERWRPDLLKMACGLDESVLPKVLGPLESAGAWRGAVVGSGTGDNMAAALSVGLRPGDVAISLGTSGTVFSVCASPTSDATGAVAGFADATGNYLPLVCTLNATKVTDAFARVLSVGQRGFEELAISASPGAGGVVVVPYLDGERTPNRPDATGAMVGFRSDVTPAQVARAAFEGVVCGLLDGLDAMGAAGVETSRGRLFLVGGGSRSIAYRRVVADLAGRIVTVPEEREHVAAGACVQAAAVLHGKQPAEVAEAWGFGGGETVEPDLGVDRESIRGRYAEAARVRE
ncbi:MAG: xylulokinase [Actinomycetota bacterium]